MTYRVQEIFATLQGEGAQAGRAAVFLRFSGCNLWDGDPAHRSSAACRFCDTEFVSMSGPGGGTYPDARALTSAVSRCWSGTGGRPLVVVTGGEPLLQLDAALLAALKDSGFEVAVETNGTVAAPPGIDWICVSPKAGTRWIQKAGNELKVVWPQPFDLEELEALPFGQRFLQPMDDPDPEVRTRHRELAVRTCLERPTWRLSFQVHKALGIP